MANQAYTWIDYEDFTGGLWERNNDLDVPQNGLTTLLNALPLVTGGLRAAPKVSVESITGLGTGAICGFHIHQAGLSTKFVLVQVDDLSIGAPKARWYDTPSNGGIAPQSPGTWVDRAPWTSDAFRHIHVPMATHFTKNPASGFRENMVFLANSFVGTIAQQGIYFMSITSTQTVFAHLNGGVGVHVLTSHQDRVIYSLTAGGTIVSGSERIEFSNPGAGGVTADYPDTNFLVVAPSISGDITDMLPSFPSDLIIIKRGGGIFLVQGDVSDPTVRQITLESPPESWTGAIDSPQGIVFLSGTSGVFAWRGGESVEHISPQLDGSPMTTAWYNIGQLGVVSPQHEPFVGSPGYGRGFIFTPKGYVLDLDTNAWFKITLPSTNIDYGFWRYDTRTGKMYGAGYNPSNGTPSVISLNLNRNTTTRVSSYEFTLPPIVLPNRRVTIRQIELTLFSHGTATGNALVTITTESGSTVLPLATVSSGSAGVKRVRINVPHVPGDFASIKVLLSNQNASIEAPTLKKMRVAYVEGPNIT